MKIAKILVHDPVLELDCAHAVASALKPEFKVQMITLENLPFALYDCADRNRMRHAITELVVFLEQQGVFGDNVVLEIVLIADTYFLEPFLAAHGRFAFERINTVHTEVGVRQTQ